MPIPARHMRRYERPDAAHLQDHGDRTDNKGDAQNRCQDLRPAQALSRDPLNVMVNENSGADGGQITEAPCKNVWKHPTAGIDEKDPLKNPCG